MKLTGALAAAVALLAVPAAVAGSGGEKIAFKRTDQAAARAAVLRRSDLGSAKGWSGGMKKPDLSPGPTCANYHPKLSDLVLTGAAESEFQHRSGLDFDSEAQVLKTQLMVALDWQREVIAPGAVPCLRQTLVKTLGSGGKLLSFGKIAFPKLTRYTAAFRAVIDVTAKGTTVPVSVEVLLVGKGRTELTLTSTGLSAAPEDISGATLRLARILASRVRA